MNPLMGLTYTRDHSQGSYLLLTKDPFLTIEDLVPVEMNMLQNYPIPGLLPIEFEQLDHSITLRYNVAVRRPLSLWSRTDAFEEKAFLKVLHAVCRQLEDSKIYMLNEQRYVLDPDYIFIGKDADDLALLYLPLKENPSPLTLHHKLICLAEKLISPLNGRSLAAKAWLDSLRNDPFNLRGCKRSLNEALAGLQTGETQTEGRKDLFPVSEQERIVSVSESPASFEFTGPEWEGLSEEPQPRKITTAHKLSAALAVTVPAVLWGMYGTAPSPGLLAAAIGFTAATAGGAYVLWKKGGVKLPLRKPNWPLADESVELPLDAGRTQEAQPVPERNPLYSAKGDTPPYNGRSAEELSGYYDRLPDKTVLLGKSDATVLLAPYPPTAWSLRLEIDKEGVKEYTEMVTETFRIGREAGTVQLLLETAGISRQHAEIVRTPEGGHLVRDLGSKNGTLLNGEVMVPFQEYELKDGDCLEMAGVRVTRTDSSPPGEAGKIQVS
ncbi:DUF6382 domain-containing protein [Paenibacillus aurantius]|uniref:DUF6382 domain-containing protein n=1 Tax=Paenibacillus aurantius TaxID=2918900 RepID=A0AA96L8T1_9BACL|nr:DUF6382 domain-containing protein [Paenibacillus aurantius]WNQ09127.1 DUF6382 domain-containing protein [Paenibacillus aurantius]